MGSYNGNNPPDKRVQVKIEVGHQAISKDNPTSLFTHDWTTFVRGSEGADISHFVEKVIFHLHESFPKPKRVCKLPPFKVSEQGYGSFTLPIEIYFRNKEEPKKYSINYELTLQLRGLPPLNYTKVEALTFLNPSDEFEKKLLCGGAVVLNPGISSDVKSSKQDKSPAAATSHGSPNSQKKSAHTHVPKVKKESQLNHSNKRPSVSDDVIPKPKKKKIVDKHEHSNCAATSNPVLKEFPLLPPTNDVDSVKAKSLNSSKKLKESRRRSTEDSPKPTVKEGSHVAKDVKVKRERKSEKKVSPSGSDPGKEPGKIMKFTLKRATDESWLATTQGNAEMMTSSLTTASTLTTTSTMLTNNSTTTSQQNDHVKRLIAEYAQQDGPSDDDNDNMVIASPKDDDINKYRLKSTPEQCLSSSISSVDSVGGELNNSSSSLKQKKPTKSQKSNSVKHRVKVHHKEAEKKIRHDVIKPFDITNVQELTDLWKKLNEIQDDDILQGVVDIVEMSGQFEITSTTFDFDLRTLDEDTVSGIHAFLNKT